MDRMSRAILTGCFSILLTAQLQAQAPRWNELRNQFALLFQQQHYSLAVDVAKEAVTVASTTFGTDHPNVAESMGNLAMAIAQKGHYSEAISLYRNAISIREKQFGPADTARLHYMKHLADVFYWQGNYPEARPAYAEVIAHSTSLYGPEHTETTGAMRGLAEVAFEEGKYAEAETLLQQAAAGIKACCGVADPLYQNTMLRLAAIYVADRQTDAAAETYRTVIATTEEHFGSTSATLAPALSGLARLVANGGNHAEAESLYKRTIDVDADRYGEMTPALAADMETLVAHYVRQEQFVAAAPYAERVVRIWEQQTTAPAINLVRACATLATVYKGIGRTEAAANAYERAIAIAGEKGELQYTVRYLSELATLYTSAGDLTAAKKTIERAFSVIEHRGGIAAADCQALREQYATVIKALDNDPKLTDTMKMHCPFSGE